ncbi:MULTISPECIES: hypothetical protein [Dehalobacter]|jgi:uncharacterized lipoprotein YehR (DUF1307 family)|uniref:Lipoprotein n=2 Tax=Dehalobacter restrictus TaxID=55583 RepID=A0A857DHC7_9FIRM|nr:MULTISPECIES: hypothetical protein [Dehalobacter]AHF11299.1 hypothetical protein DEHRE_04630 [Dehalobacter restrictus DSM 9455]MCG1025992.1 hypothetical protein [Dehalobacter sp.]OCZ53195.1 hypothetical protein A7D23_08910 [Dehalobacter sp. TeCB1]QHA00038.1 hypothetical protein GQ588_04940 [Dehalobacter restrictus]
MKTIRYFVTVVIIVCMAFMMTACGSGSKIDENSEAQSQGNAAQSTNSDLDVGENLKWPTDSMGNLPGLKGKISAVLKDDSTGQCTVAFSEMAKEDAQAYIAEMKKRGYTGELSVADEESLIHSGKAANGSTAVFTYNVTAKEGTISFGTGDASGQSATAVDMTDAASWPENYMEGVPELVGRIVDVVNDNNKSVTVSLEHVDKAIFEDYIKLLKLNGFTKDVDESTSVSSSDFRAYNAKGEWANACLNIVEGNNTATITMEKPAQ